MSLVSILNGETLSASGSAIFRGGRPGKVCLYWNITGSVSGSVQFTLADVDPTDEVTPNGGSASTSAITVPSAGVLALPAAVSPATLVSWTVSGGPIVGVSLAADVSDAVFGLSPEGFDYTLLTYTGANLTQVVYKKGGASGIVLATVDLTYTGANLDTVTKTVP